MWYWHDGLNGWDWIWMSAMMVVVWVPLLFAVIWALRAFTQPAPQTLPPRDASGEGPDARDLARLAYARGELDRKRYLEILEDLDRSEQPALKR